jgi:hypothetical protein
MACQSVFTPVHLVLRALEVNRGAGHRPANVQTRTPCSGRWRRSWSWLPQGRPHTCPACSSKCSSCSSTARRHSWASSGPLSNLALASCASARIASRSTGSRAQRRRAILAVSSIVWSSKLGSVRVIVGLLPVRDPNRKPRTSQPSPRAVSRWPTDLLGQRRLESPSQVKVRLTLSPPRSYEQQLILGRPFCRCTA